jgi:hypothetical protein
MVVLTAGCAHPSGLRPIADRPITLDARCDGTGQTGLLETSRLQVATSSVRALAWRIEGGTRGRCEFELADFEQRRARPHIELAARNGSGCRLMIWRDPRHITLSHAGCEGVCPAGLLKDALPILFDPASGGCAAS